MAAILAIQKRLEKPPVRHHLEANKIIEDIRNMCPKIVSGNHRIWIESSCYPYQAQSRFRGINVHRTGSITGLRIQTWWMQLKTCFTHSTGRHTSRYVCDPIKTVIMALKTTKLDKSKYRKLETYWQVVNLFLWTYATDDSIDDNDQEMIFSPKQTEMG